MTPLRIVIVDDHAVVRRGVRALLESHPGWEVSAEGSTGREAVELVKRLHPDVVVMDLSLPELNGLDATRQILAAGGPTRVLILTAHESEQLIREVLRAGAQGYVLKSDAGRALVSAVEALVDGRPFFTSKIAQLVLDGYLRNETDGPDSMPALSAREREIVQLLAEGRSNKEVARELGISVKTAETHRSNIMRKMEFGSLSDLIRYAVRNKIIEV